MSDKITIYRPNQRHDLGFIETWVVMARNIWSARELVWELFKRDFLAGYKKSFMGFTWIFITPILGIVSWVFLQKTGMLKPGEMDIPYPAYVLIGTSMWGLFIGFFQWSSMTLQSGQALVMQVNFPHEALLFKATAQHVAQFVITFGMNIIVLILFGVMPSWGILLFPFVALPLFFLGSAIGLTVSMIAVVAMDISRGIGLVMGLMMYLTPVIYSRDVDNSLVQLLIKWNPLTYLVCSCRDIIIHGRLYDNTGYFISAGLSLVLFLISWRLFYVSEDKLVERMI